MPSQQPLTSSNIPCSDGQPCHPMGLTIETAAVGAPTSGIASHPDMSSRSSIGSSEDSINGSSDLENYDLDNVILAWGQIIDLSHEITSSLMAKQASVLCENFRQQESTREAKEKQQQQQQQDEPVPKRRKLETSADSTIVTSDEETAPDLSSEKEDQRGGGLGDGIYQQVDRLGRISKLVMEIEYCQSELRKEMMGMNEEL